MSTPTGMRTPPGKSKSSFIFGDSCSPSAVHSAPPAARMTKSAMERPVDYSVVNNGGTKSRGEARNITPRSRNSKKGRRPMDLLSQGFTPITPNQESAFSSPNGAFISSQSSTGPTSANNSSSMFTASGNGGGVAGRARMGLSSSDSFPAGSFSFDKHSHYHNNHHQSPRTNNTNNNVLQHQNAARSRVGSGGKHAKAPRPRPKSFAVDEGVQSMSMGSMGVVTPVTILKKGEAMSPATVLTQVENGGKQRPSRTSPTNYCGPKFTESPDPSQLPLPPSHWLADLKMTNQNGSTSSPLVEKMENGSIKMEKENVMALAARCGASESPLQPGLRMTGRQLIDLLKA